MRESGSHPTERQLLMAADGELPARDAEKVRTHLNACWACRTRMDDLNRTVAEFVHFRNSELNEQLPPAAKATLQLEARLSLLASELDSGKMLRQSVATLSHLAYAATAALLALGIAWVTAREFRPQSHRSAVPQARLTPGDTVFMSKADVCTSALENDPAAVPASLRQAVFREYGVSEDQPREYELDYLITPKLGGATSLRNLWPEPYSARWNARVKDQLEDRLHSMVCRGDIDLATAQRDIATDWVAAYRKYFHSNRPVEDR